MSPCQCTVPPPPGSSVIVLTFGEQNYFDGTPYHLYHAKMIKYIERRGNTVNDILESVPPWGENSHVKENNVCPAGHVQKENGQK